MAIEHIMKFRTEDNFQLDFIIENGKLWVEYHGIDYGDSSIELSELEDLIEILNQCKNKLEGNGEN